LFKGLPETFTFAGSVWNTYLISLGLIDPAVYFRALNTQSNMLVGIFTIASLLIVVILMNMLIALMGDIQA
jgi:hypothetical protein